MKTRSEQDKSNYEIKKKHHYLKQIVGIKNV
jgi:hypothetical protein